nr:hypothetical protein [Tanacetum cinerariifolium]
MVPSPSLSHTITGTVTVDGGGGPVAEDIFLVSVELSLKPSSTPRIEDVKFAFESNTWKDTGRSSRLMTTRLILMRIGFKGRSRRLMIID